MEMSKEGVYEPREPNYIGQIGEIIGRGILEKEFPSPIYRVIRSHTYSYSNDIFELCELKYPFGSFHTPPNGTLAIAIDLSDIDFLLQLGSERVIVEVKTTMRKSFSLSR